MTITKTQIEKIVKSGNNVYDLQVKLGKEIVDNITSEKDIKFLIELSSGKPAGKLQVFSIYSLSTYFRRNLRKSELNDFNVENFNTLISIKNSNDEIISRFGKQIELENILFLGIPSNGSYLNYVRDAQSLYENNQDPSSAALFGDLVATAIKKENDTNKKIIRDTFLDNSISSIDRAIDSASVYPKYHAIKARLLANGETQQNYDLAHVEISNAIDLEYIQLQKVKNETKRDTILNRINYYQEIRNEITFEKNNLQIKKQNDQQSIKLASVQNDLLGTVSILIGAFAIIGGGTKILQDTNQKIAAITLLIFMFSMLFVFSSISWIIKPDQSKLKFEDFITPRGVATIFSLAMVLILLFALTQVD